MKTKRYYKNQNTQLLSEINDCNTKIEKLKNHLDNLEDIIKNYETKFKTIEKELKKTISSDTKHQVEIIKLKDEIKSKDKQIKDLELKLEESMTDKYLVKKIPSGRTPKGQKIGLKSGAVQSKIIAGIYKDEKDE